MAEAQHREILVIGAGVSGIYQIKKLIELGFDAALLEADEDLGGTWYRNRYPGCRFDSESYTYGYTFSEDLLDEWHWKERFSSQPENLKYLNHVAEKFDLRRHMTFNARIASMRWDDLECLWHLTLTDGQVHSARFVITSLGPLSAATLPSYDGMDDFEGESFHTFHWPKAPVPLEGRRVGIVGTGATGIQIIGAIADQVGELKVFQRRPNWSSPLNNAPISNAEMAEIRSRYPQILANCALSNGGFEHVARWGFWDATAEERKALWDELYTQPGFSILAANYAEIFLDESANRELSEYIADRIRARVDDPAVAEKLIPKDHGFGLQRLPLETDYFEAYNRSNVELVDISAAPIERITPTGIQTSATHHDLDLIIWATGFDAITGAYDRIDIQGVDGVTLREHWAENPSTYFGLLANRFPNLLMVAGPQSVSGSTNFPRAIERGVDWITALLEHARANDYTRVEARPEAEQQWQVEVAQSYERLLLRQSKGWFTGYNSNVAGHGEGQVRHQAYFGGAPRYSKRVTELQDSGYPGLDMALGAVGLADLRSGA